MPPAEFRALLLEKRDDAVEATVTELPLEALPEGDVMVRVAYSDLNYKDGLALNGNARVVRSYPMIPGIDFSGTVELSTSPLYQPGDAVIGTGWGLGEERWGGYAQLARVPAGWLVSLPKGLTLEQAMGLGTAGLTAMLSLMALEEYGLMPGGREVVVTGASGGVGSVAVALLAHVGYRVVASTGSAEVATLLTELGAAEAIGREVLATPSERPLESARWGGAVDTVGGETLAGLLRTMAHGAGVAACGNAGGNRLDTTVLPFILRGVGLLGIDSARCPIERRREAWERLARDMPLDALTRLTQAVPLQDVPELGRRILEGGINGRVVVDVNT